MSVISNTSPLLNLAIVDHLFLLPQQFGQIIIPEAGLAELKINDDLPGSSLLNTAVDEGWFVVKALENQALVNRLRRELHQGPSEAIALAVELSADKVLLDAKEARQAARALGLSITGIVGMLLRGWQDRSIPSLRNVCDRLPQDANFWLSPALQTQILQVSSNLEADSGD